MRIQLIIFAAILLQVHAYTVAQFNTCLTKNCGEIACWKANDPTKCTKLKSAYDTCVSSGSDNCATFTKEWNDIQNNEGSDMISYGSCFSDCENKLESDDYLYYYYKCYQQCSDNVYSSLKTFCFASILFIILLF